MFRHMTIGLALVLGTAALARATADGEPLARYEALFTDVDASSKADGIRAFRQAAIERRQEAFRVIEWKLQAARELPDTDRATAFRAVRAGMDELYALERLLRLSLEAALTLWGLGLLDLWTAVGQERGINTEDAKVVMDLPGARELLPIMATLDPEHVQGLFKPFEKGENATGPRPVTPTMELAWVLSSPALKLDMSALLARIGETDPPPTSLLEAIANSHFPPTDETSPSWRLSVARSNGRLWLSRARALHETLGNSHRVLLAGLSTPFKGQPPASPEAVATARLNMDRAGVPLEEASQIQFLLEQAFDFWQSKLGAILVP